MSIGEFSGPRGNNNVASQGQLKPAGITMPTDTGDDGLGQFGQRLDGSCLEMGFRRPLAFLNVFEVVAG